MPRFPHGIDRTVCAALAGGWAVALAAGSIAHAAEDDEPVRGPIYAVDRICEPMPECIDEFWPNDGRFTRGEPLLPARARPRPDPVPPRVLFRTGEAPGLWRRPPDATAVAAQDGEGAAPPAAVLPPVERSWRGVRPPLGKETR